MRKFNVTGICVPEENYMVDITDKLEQIKTMVDAREYFTINRGRQYGKTTTLLALEEFLSNEYIVISLSFEGLGEKPFATEENFCCEFLKLIKDALELSGHEIDEQEKWENESVNDFTSLSRHIRQVCKNSTSKYVLMIDEVDKTSNNIIFLNFLSKLREKYLARKAKKDFTFHSVILASVYDIRNIKLRLTREGLHAPAIGETVINNSPWNIASTFKVDMSFSETEIETMLLEYEKEHQTGMDIPKVSEEIHLYTSGYPVLVSSICKHIDEELGKKWDVEGIGRAIQLILKENSPLFESLIKNLTANEELSNLVYNILMVGSRLPFNLDDPFVNLGARYGYFKDSNHQVKISNKIFEMRLTNYFINKTLHERIQGNPLDLVDGEGIVQNNRFNMQICLEKFAKYYHEYYSENDIKFIEREARYLFLLFISPVLNGHGFAYIESQSTDYKRTDIIVNYLDQQFIIELKIWRGEKLHHDAFEQLLGYMDRKRLSEGYLLTFDFRQKRRQRQEWIEVKGGKKIFDIVV